MSDRPPFDAARAGFYLVVVVICVQLTIVLAGVGMCLIHADQIVAGSFRCDRDNRLAELLGSALSTAAAFVAGALSNKR